MFPYALTLGIGSLYLTTQYIPKKYFANLKLFPHIYKTFPLVINEQRWIDINKEIVKLSPHIYKTFPLVINEQRWIDINREIVNAQRIPISLEEQFGTETAKVIYNSIITSSYSYSNEGIKISQPISYHELIKLGKAIMITGDFIGKIQKLPFSLGVEFEPISSDDLINLYDTILMGFISAFFYESSNLLTHTIKIVSEYEKLPLYKSIKEAYNSAWSVLKAIDFNEDGYFINVANISEDEYSTKATDVSEINSNNNASYIPSIDKISPTFITYYQHIFPYSTISNQSLAYIIPDISNVTPIVAYFNKYVSQEILNRSIPLLRSIHLLISNIDLILTTHFAAGILNKEGDIFKSMLTLGAFFASSLLYDYLAELNTDVHPTDLANLAQACRMHIAVGGSAGLAVNIPLYGAIRGAAICYDQLLDESPNQQAIRYAANILCGVSAFYKLSDHDPLIQAIGIGIISHVSDLTARVSMVTAELAITGGISSLFRVDESDYI